MRSSGRIDTIRSLASRAQKICSPVKLTNELKSIKKFASWNGFPKLVVDKIITKALSPKTQNQSSETETDIVVYFRMPYCGTKGFTMYRSCISKIRRFLKNGKNIKFKLLNDVSRIEMFCSKKDVTPKLCRSNVVYRFTCPACGDSYVGKTERTLFERTREHGWSDKNSAVHQHILKCDNLCFMQNQLCFDIPQLSPDERKAHYLNIVRNNTSIVDSSPNRNILLFKEALYIKRLKPVLNNGLKASRDLYLF